MTTTVTLILTLCVVSLSPLPSYSTRITKSLECSLGFLSNETKFSVPPNRINDNYCDCPVDGGMDEFSTEACSGSLHGGWTGIKKQHIRCLQYPNLYLHQSRLNDYICDCCDGSDEINTSCTNVCDNIHKAQRLTRSKLIGDYECGSQKRRLEIENFRVMKNITMEKIHLLKHNAYSLENEVKKIDDILYSAKISSIRNRFNKYSTVFQSIGESIPGTSTQLEDLIASACHLYGEMDGNEDEFSENKTCAPLRLSGMYMGILWMGEKDNDTTVRYNGWEDDLLALDIINILIRNFNYDNSKIPINLDGKIHKNMNSLHHLRGKKFKETVLDDDYFPEYYSDFDHVAEQLGEDKEQNDSNSDSLDYERTQHKINDNIHNKHDFSSSVRFWRESFYLHAKNIVSKIDDMNSNNVHDNIEEETLDSHNTVKNGINSDQFIQSPLDPMVLQMVRADLFYRLRRVNRGDNLATSANVLLKALRDDVMNEKNYQHILSGLVGGVLYYAQLSAADVAELIALYNTQYIESSFISPYTSICPPEVSKISFLNNTGILIDFPTDTLLSDINRRCIERNVNSDSHLYRSSSSGIEMINMNSIPIVIPDGYFDFFIPVPRGADDYFTNLFRSLNADDFLDFYSILAEEESREKTVKTLAETMGQIKGLEEEQGINNQERYGADGDLYGIKDECLEITSNKYTYKLCILGKASQREGDKRSSSLGYWDGIVVNMENGRKTMRWMGGQKCWNGLSRSATVHVTCSNKMRLVSVDEPNTCEYVLEMESYIACDDSFKESEMF